jgi:superfamily I DNA/RNA helicase
MVLARDATPSVAPLLDALDPEQRAAATLPDGPAQIIAPAGSGQTTTLIARLGVLLSRGVAAERIAVVTFNREAAEELSARIGTQLGPLLPGAEQIEDRGRFLSVLAGGLCRKPSGESPAMAGTVLPGHHD